MLTIADINRTARDYVAAFAQRGAATFIANLDTSLHLHRWGDHDLPVTVNDGTAGATFVCSPRVGYIDYPLEELAHFPNPQVAPQTDDLAAKHPAHLLAMRSLTRRYNAPLMDSLEAAGWALLPSRQVFLIADFARECMPRRDFKRDEALWRRGDYRYEELSAMGPDDAARIVALYNMLYLDKYSRLNPAYTPEFVALTHQIGLIRYLVLRDQAGTIQGFGGMYRAGLYATMPLLGYNTAEAQDRGLYRLSFHAGTRYALDRQLQFNMSSGATGFKRNRGATAEMEFTAYYLRHLPWSRRVPFMLLRTIANQIGMPLLRTFEL